MTFPVRRFSFSNLTVSWKCSCVIGRLKKKEHTSHLTTASDMWRLTSNFTLLQIRGFLADTDTELLSQLLQPTCIIPAQPLMVFNCLKQIINDRRHHWLFRSQYRNQYEKPLSSIQQTTCTHGTQDLVTHIGHTRPIHTRLYCQRLYCATIENVKRHRFCNTVYTAEDTLYGQK